MIDNTTEYVRLISDLITALAEVHQDEIDHNHYGDDPATCEYCQLIARGEAAQSLDWRPK